MFAGSSFHVRATQARQMAGRRRENDATPEVTVKKGEKIVLFSVNPRRIPLDEGEATEGKEVNDVAFRE